MMSIYKGLLFTIAALGIFFSIGHGQEDHAAAFVCDDVVFTIVGPDAVVTDNNYNYAISVSLIRPDLYAVDNLETIVVPQEILDETTVRYELLYGSRILQRSTDPYFDVFIDQLGLYTVRALVAYRGCDYTLTLPIHAYEGIFAYIGPYVDEFGMGIVQNMSQNDLFLRPFVVDDLGTSVLPTLRQHWSVLVQAQDIYFSVKNYSLIFDVLRLIDNDPTIDISQKRIFIIDDMEKSVVKKILARFTRTFDNASLYVISEQEAMNMFLQFSIGKRVLDQGILDNSLLQFSGGARSYGLGYVVDYLLFQGFPLDMLLLILSCVFVVLFIVFCKQIVGISSYGVYYPLLFAIALHVVGPKTSLFLLVVAFLAKILTIAFTRRFTLLATAKLGLQIVLYVFFTIIGLVFLNSLGWVNGDFLVFTYPMMLFVYFGILIVASKLWTTSTVIPSLKHSFSIIIFVCVSVLSYLLIQSEVLHHVILLHPSLVLLAILLIVLLGRYTGLQLMEVIRFWPLIKHLNGKK